MTLETRLQVKNLPSGLQDALKRCGNASKLVTVRANDERSIACGYSGYRISTACEVPDVNVTSAITIHRGAFGGNNGYNKPRGAWDPDHDQEPKLVPANGAILDGYPEDGMTVTVRAATFAAIVAPGSAEALVAGDASQEGREAFALALAQEALASSLPVVTDAECAVIYAYCGLKSCDGRKQIASAHASAVESLVARGLLKCSRNGATSATAEAQAIYSSLRTRCQSAAMKVTSPWLYATESR